MASNKITEAINKVNSFFQATEENNSFVINKQELIDLKILLLNTHANLNHMMRELKTTFTTNVVEVKEQVDVENSIEEIFNTYFPR